MPQLNPFIHFNGNAEEAFQFYKSVFGGEFSKIIRFKDIEGLEANLISGEEKKIMQISLAISENSVLMGSDVPAFMGQVNERENRSKISVHTETKEQAEKVFNGLSSNGEIEVPFDHSSAGSYFGMLRDKYGVEWMINYIH